MKLHEARAAIAAIVEAIPDGELPKPSKVEGADTERPCVWFGSHGFHVGSGKRGGEPHPVDWHRSTAIQDLFDREAAQRYERDWWLAIDAASKAVPA